MDLNDYELIKIISHLIRRRIGGVKAHVLADELLSMQFVSQAEFGRIARMEKATVSYMTKHPWSYDIKVVRFCGRTFFWMNSNHKKFNSHERQTYQDWPVRSWKASQESKQ